MNFELSRKFIGKTNTTYKKLQNLTDFSEELPPSPGKRGQWSGSGRSQGANPSLGRSSVDGGTSQLKEADQK